MTGSSAAVEPAVEHACRADGIDDAAPAYGGVGFGGCDRGCVHDQAAAGHPGPGLRAAEVECEVSAGG
ncbi:hypothetical protein ACWCOV_00575 [Kribbella sp. NPDC002412]